MWQYFNQMQCFWKTFIFILVLINEFLHQTDKRTFGSLKAQIGGDDLFRQYSQSPQSHLFWKYRICSNVTGLRAVSSMTSGRWVLGKLLASAEMRCVGTHKTSTRPQTSPVPPGWPPVFEINHAHIDVAAFCLPSTASQQLQGAASNTPIWKL